MIVELSGQTGQVISSANVIALFSNNEPNYTVNEGDTCHALHIQSQHLSKIDG